MHIVFVGIGRIGARSSLHEIPHTLTTILSPCFTDGQGRCSHGYALGRPFLGGIGSSQGDRLRPPIAQAGNASGYHRGQRLVERDSREFCD